MSTLKANTILAASGLAADPVAIPGLDKRFASAWVNFNGSGVVAIRDSYNVSSITDNGVGTYTVNFTTSMANANFAVAGTAGYGTLTAGSQSSVGIYGSMPTVSGVGVAATSHGSGSNSLTDATFVMVAVFGGRA